MNNLSEADKKKMMLANQKSITGLLEQMKGEIARCLPKHLSPERMARIATTELRKNPKLMECDPISFIAAIMQASQLGLEPGVMGSCYLIPFNNRKSGKVECTFIAGYRGLLDLARRSGQIVSLSAHAVYEKDLFDFEYGLEQKLVHKPALENKGNIIAVYAIAKLKDGGYQFEIMSKQEIDKIRGMSKNGEFGIWASHYDEMARKTVLRRLFKWLPCSVEMQKTVMLDEQAEVGVQDIKSALSEDIDIDFLTYDNDTGEIMETKLEPQKEVVMSQADKIAEELKNKKG